VKHTQALNVLTNSLLRFIRDEQPTVAEFLERFGGSGGQVFHVLRKEGIVQLEAERLRLNPQHLSEDGRSFAYEAYVFWIDTEEVWHVCRSQHEQNQSVR
jgi:hypothetical protein